MTLQSFVVASTCQLLFTRRHLLDDHDKEFIVRLLVLVRLLMCKSQFIDVSQFTLKLVAESVIVFIHTFHQLSISIHSFHQSLESRLLFNLNHVVAVWSHRLSGVHPPPHPQSSVETSNNHAAFILTHLFGYRASELNLNLSQCDSNLIHRSAPSVDSRLFHKFIFCVAM
ncbi:MAG: hypothetical protein WCG25_06750 [bacterium]